MSSSLKRGMERHRAMPPAPLTAGGPRAAAGPGRQQRQGQGGGLCSRGRCWGPQHRLCFADSEAACLQRCRLYPGHTPALKAEGERWLIAGGARRHPNARHIQPPPALGSPGQPVPVAGDSWVQVRSKASWQGWMVQKSSANILSVLHPAPVSLPVHYTKPFAWKD